jgi:hypothetical protein
MTVLSTVDLIPVLLFTFGLIAMAKPEWVAAIDRRQKAAGTTRRPGDIEMGETYYAVVRMAGVGFTLFGLLFVVQSW